MRLLRSKVATAQCGPTCPRVCIHRSNSGSSATTRLRAIIAATRIRLRWSMIAIFLGSNAMMSRGRSTWRLSSKPVTHRTIPVAGCSGFAKSAAGCRQPHQCIAASNHAAASAWPDATAIVVLFRLKERIFRLIARRCVRGKRAHDLRSSPRIRRSQSRSNSCDSVNVEAAAVTKRTVGALPCHVLPGCIGLHSTRRHWRIRLSRSLTFDGEVPIRAGRPLFFSLGATSGAGIGSGTRIGSTTATPAAALSAAPPRSPTPARHAPSVPVQAPDLWHPTADRSTTSTPPPG